MAPSTSPTADAPSHPDVRPGPPAVAFENLSLVFPDGTHAIDRISFAVHRGELVSVVGPSGCGKSTLLRLIAGFEAPSRGSVEVGTDESVGYVFQDATLLPWRTVLRNVELPAQLAGVPKAEARARALAALELVGLGPFAGHRPAQLSGGMKMRVSISRALTMDPSVFLFDEPFGALDEMTRERLNEELTSLFRAQPFAGLFVTHSVPESVFLSTRVLVLSHRPGRIIADIDVPFPYPRDPDLRFTPEFVALTEQVSHALRGAPVGAGR